MKKMLFLIMILGIIFYNLNLSISHNNKQALTLVELKAKACDDVEGLSGYILLMEHCTYFKIFSTFPYAAGWVGGCRDADDTCSLP